MPIGGADLCDSDGVMEYSNTPIGAKPLVLQVVIKTQLFL